MPCVVYDSNSIAGVGGEALASLFLRGSPIEELDLDSNRIGDDGGVAFAIALRRCPTLLAYVMFYGTCELDVDLVVIF